MIAHPCIPITRCIQTSVVPRVLWVELTTGHVREA